MLEPGVVGDCACSDSVMGDVTLLLLSLSGDLEIRPM